jgi:hypothetical protein
MIYGVVGFGVLAAIGTGVFCVLALQQAYKLFRAADRHEGGSWARLAFCERALGARDREILRLRAMNDVREREILRLAVKLRRQLHTLIRMQRCRAAQVVRVPAASRN